MTGYRSTLIVVNFAVWPAHVELEAQEDFELPRGGESNLFRGALGAALHRICGCAECRGVCAPRNSDQCIYRRFFKPLWREGPSGYRDAPRPFVLRPRLSARLELVSFDLEIPWALFEQAFALAAKRVKTKLVRLDIADKICLPVTGQPACGTARVEFATPAEIKESGAVLEQPQFAPLIRRLAERVQALGVLYQGWPPEWSAGDLLAGSEDVKLDRYHWVRSHAFRRRSSTGHLHSVGGFTGWAEYSGRVGKFVPLLQIGHWTGVGRQTVWGKGEIRVSNFTT